MDKLTPDQARAVCEAVHPMHGYLFRLVERMDRTNLSLRDPRLYRLARAAEDALHRLWVELHYQSCGRGVGRPAPVTDPDPPPGGSPPV
jgi:hypothetical protein